jgi:hypothetical protein
VIGHASGFRDDAAGGATSRCRHSTVPAATTPAPPGYGHGAPVMTIRILSFTAKGYLETVPPSWARGTRTPRGAFGVAEELAGTINRAPLAAPPPGMPERYPESINTAGSAP